MHVYDGQTDHVDKTYQDQDSYYHYTILLRSVNLWLKEEFNSSLVGIGGFISIYFQDFNLIIMLQNKTNFDSVYLEYQMPSFLFCIIQKWYPVTRCEGGRPSFIFEIGQWPNIIDSFPIRRLKIFDSLQSVNRSIVGGNSHQRIFNNGCRHYRISGVGSF